VSRQSVHSYRRTISGGRIVPAQAIAIDKNNATQNATIIHSSVTSAFWKVLPKPLHSRLRQPINIAHHISTKNGDRESSQTDKRNQLMGPDPRLRRFNSAMQRDHCCWGKDCRVISKPRSKHSSIITIIAVTREPEQLHTIRRLLRT
jgi:hypothetical protein